MTERSSEQARGRGEMSSEMERWAKSALINDGLLGFDLYYHEPFIIWRSVSRGKARASKRNEKPVYLFSIIIVVGRRTEEEKNYKIHFKLNHKLECREVKWKRRNFPTWKLRWHENEIIWKREKRCTKWNERKIKLMIRIKIQINYWEGKASAERNWDRPEMSDFGGGRKKLFICKTLRQ